MGGLARRLATGCLHHAHQNRRSYLGAGMARGTPNSAMAQSRCRPLRRSGQRQALEPSTRNMQTYRVLISGAGVAGLSLAYWLAKAGHAVTIVERGTSLRAGGPAVDF